MKRFVIDANVLVKLFFDEEHSEASVEHVNKAAELVAPDLLWVEAANVIWKRLRRGELTADDAVGIVAEMLRVPIVTYSGFELVSSALTLAGATGRTVYDCLYLALAIRENVPLLTADERLANAMKSGPFAKRIVFVGQG
jgi:predicted nucleic acid-binding protein